MSNYMIKEMNITPEIAKNYLQANTSNRPVRLSQVEKYANEMIEGTWNTDVIDPICISVNGNLINGQHRLMAVIKANKTIPMWVQYNLPESHYKIIDSGVGRTLYDRLSVVNRKKISALTKSCFATEYGKSSLINSYDGKIKQYNGTSITPTDPKLIDYAHEHLELLQECNTNGNRLRNVFGKGSLRAFSYAYWLIKWLGIDNKLDMFVEDFSNDISLDRNTQLIKNAMLKQMAKGNMTTTEIISFVLYAYEMFRSDKAIKNVSGASRMIAKYENLIRIKRGF